MRSSNAAITGGGGSQRYVATTLGGSDRALRPSSDVAPTPDASWLLIEEGFNRAREHETGSLFAVSNGYVGTRGTLAEGAKFAAPATLVAGVFTVPNPGAIPELISVSDWTSLAISVSGLPLSMEHGETLEHRRILDFRQGILWRDWRHCDPQGRITLLRFLRLASLADRHLVLRSLMLTAENYSDRVRMQSSFPEVSVGDAPVCPVDGISFVDAKGSQISVALTSVSQLDDDGTLIPKRDPQLPAVWEFEAEIGKTYRLDRLVCLYSSREASAPEQAAIYHIQRALATCGIPQMIDAHRKAWADRWSSSDVQVDGDPESQRALRFAAYHLIAAANPEDERVSIGARALTGEAYKGHVFWDTEIYMLPFYIYTYPTAARSLLMYRYHTLAGAREKARGLGYRGALYAWESAGDDGRETTPTNVLGPDGQMIRVLCGELEQHISADVAYGVWHYWQATGDDRFFVQAGAEIILDTARFWASRVEPGVDGLYHIRHIIGPDEYHEAVDDDAYTNVLAQWNLARGVETVNILRDRWPSRANELFSALDLSPDEPANWAAIGPNIYTGFDTMSGLYEQFHGYFDLEDIDLAAYEPRTASMDVLLGRERTQKSQIIKQADVVMLLALLWDQLSPAARAANFAYYEPRTGHGSSLSPAMHALVAARLGDVVKAEALFRQAARIDLADNMGNASGGVHAAALGGLWQAAVFGFGGMSLAPNGLSFNPILPADWRDLRYPIRWRDRELSIRIVQQGDGITLEVELLHGRNMTINVGANAPVELSVGHPCRLHKQNADWQSLEEVQEDPEKYKEENLS